MNAKPLFQDPKTCEPWVLEEVLETYFKTLLASIQNLSEKDIVQKDTSELIQLIQSKNPLTEINFFDPSSRAPNDSGIEIHIPFSGTATILFGCPKNEIKNRPQILAIIYDTQNAKSYCASSNIWHGPFVRHGEDTTMRSFVEALSKGQKLKDHVLVLYFENDQISQINSTIQTIKNITEKSNEVIQKYQDKWRPLLEQEIESVREKVTQKQTQLNSLGFKTQSLIDTVDPLPIQTPHLQLTQTYPNLLPDIILESKHPELKRLHNQNSIDTPLHIKREARKLKTQEKYNAWQKAYKKLIKSHPNQPDTWYSKKISKMEIAKGAKPETIRKHMKK